MKKSFLFILIILSLFIFNGCNQANEPGDTYITNTINITWKGSFSSAPSNPEIGWAYYDTTKRMSFVWDGSEWQVIAQDGKSIIWRGELSQAPLNPEENWAYYNTVDGNSYIYNGSSWNYLAKAGRDGASGIMLWLGSYSEAPLNPSEGYCYYNTISCCSYIWNGNSWEIISKDGLSIIWKGALYSAPSNPDINWAYYNINQQISYIWNGSSWNILAQSAGGDTTVSVSVNWRGSFTSAPSNPAIGDAYYNSTLKASYIYDGSVWQQISKDGQDGTYTYSGTGYLITWKGSFSSHPSNPKAGWAYYNSNEKKSYIYDGSSWQIMTIDGTSSSSSSGDSSYIYIGESTETIDSITYIVKSYADVDTPEPYFYTYYKFYYLNNKLRRTYVFYHNCGSVDLDYKYDEFVEHVCGSNTGNIVENIFYDSGILQKAIIRYESNDVEFKQITYFNENGKKTKLEIYQNSIMYSATKYFESGKTKEAISYDMETGVKKSHTVYNSTGQTIISLIYDNSGNLSIVQTYDNAKKQLTINYNSTTLSSLYYYYESGYVKYYYIDGYLYTYSDGKTTSGSTNSSLYSSKEAKTQAQIISFAETLYDTQYN